MTDLSDTGPPSSEARLQYYRDALAACRQGGTGAQTVVQLKLLASLCGVGGGQYREMVQSLGMEDATFTDGSGQTLGEWFAQRELDAKGRCACGMATVPGFARCPSCGEAVRAGGALVQLSPQTLQRWHRLPRGFALGRLWLLAAGLFTLALAAILALVRAL